MPFCISLALTVRSIRDKMSGVITRRKKQARSYEIATRFGFKQ